MKTKRANQAYVCDGCVATIAKGSQYARVGKRVGSSRPDSMEMRNGNPVILMHGFSVDLYLCASCASSPPALDAEVALTGRSAREHRGKHVSVHDDHSRWNDGACLPLPWCGAHVGWDEVVDGAHPERAVKFDVCGDCKVAIIKANPHPLEVT